MTENFKEEWGLIRGGGLLTSDEKTWGAYSKGGGLNRGRGLIRGNTVYRTDGQK